LKSELLQDELGKKVDTYSFKYILTEAAKKKDKGKESKKNKADDGEAYKEAIRDTKISWLAKLPADSKEAKVFHLRFTNIQFGVSYHVLGRVNFSIKTYLGRFGQQNTSRLFRL
jgi:hypothetical protein